MFAQVTSPLPGGERAGVFWVTPYSAQALMLAFSDNQSTILALEHLSCSPWIHFK